MDQTQGKENELTCGLEDGISGSHLHGGFTLANQSALNQNENRSVGYGKSCTMEEFQRFESIFTKFTAIAREHFLPPERQRFGLISERSLLPFLGVGSPETWLIILHSSACPNCSVIFQEEEDLRTILQNHHSLVIEVILLNLLSFSLLIIIKVGNLDYTVSTCTDFLMAIGIIWFDEH